MSEGGLTRRSLLGATAGALAAGALRPVDALALLGAPEPPVLREQTVGRLGRGSTTIALRGNADLVGAAWNGPPGSLMVRLPGRQGGLSRWVPAAGCAPHAGGAQRGGTAGVIGDPIWTGGVRRLELRAERPLGDVRIFLVDVSGGMGARRRALSFAGLATHAPLPLAAPVLEAGPGQPAIIARRAWAGSGCPPAVDPEYGAVRLAFVHHTDNPNGYGAYEVPAMLRAIYAFHRFARGWNDIGYNFVVDLYGRIFEARAGGIDEAVIGAQAGGYNYASTGIAMLGTFSAQPISAAARRALEHLLAWKLALHGVPAAGSEIVRVDPSGAVYSRYPAGARVALPRIAGHRDADTTDCPGAVLYRQLPAMRPRVAGMQGAAARATLTLTGLAGAPTPGSAPVTGTLSGRLSTLAGDPLAGVPLAIQERVVERRGEAVSERTVAQASTDALGDWSLAVEIAHRRPRSALRAISLGAPGGAAPAAVSESLQLPGVLAGVGSTGTPGGSPPAGEAAPAPAASAGGAAP